MDLTRLVSLAEEVRYRAYAPYSKFLVGAAVLSSSGKVYVGCNVENATYGATNCAERVAIGSMVAAGDRELVAVAVFTDAPVPATPCGICRQVLAEFAREATVIVATPRMQKSFQLSALLPERFALELEESQHDETRDAGTRDDETRDAGTREGGTREGGTREG